jgi:hypothetical protein
MDNGQLTMNVDCSLFIACPRRSPGETLARTNETACPLDKWLPCGTLKANKCVAFGSWFIAMNREP